MKDKKEILKDAEELSLDALKKATGGHGEPVVTDTKDVTEDVKDKV